MLSCKQEGLPKISRALRSDMSDGVRLGLIKAYFLQVSMIHLKKFLVGLTLTNPFLRAVAA